MKKTKGIIALLILSVMVLTIGIITKLTFAQSAAASDIEGHWASKEISNWIEQGLVEGYPDGTFKPDNGITRAEFATLVNRSFKLDDMAAISFKDVNENDWFYKEIAKAKKAGYLSGYEDGTVKPNTYIKRQEVAAIIARLKALQENPSEAYNFSDIDSIPEWSKGFIGAVVKANYMRGYPNGNFEPVKNITRAEAVVALNNILGIKIEEIKEQTIKVNNTINVAVITEPADANLSIQNSDDKVVKATLSGAYIGLKGLKEGTATISVMAKKEGLLDGVVTFKVIVEKAASSGSSGGGGGGSSSNKRPVITVVEPDGLNDGVITLAVGVQFVAPTVTASDKEDGDITSRIVKAGEDKIDTSKVGEYLLTYNVKDSKGLAATECKVLVKVVEVNTIDETANITVDVAEAMPTFKSITVNSSTAGTKFKVEGSTLVKEFGESIVVNTSETTRIVSILDGDGNVLGTITLDVSSDSTKNYTFKAQETDETANITVDVAEAMPTFKSITVNSSTAGTKFKVEGSTLVKAFGESIVVNTSETTRTVSILDGNGNLIGTVTVDVSSDNTEDYDLQQL